MHLVLVGRSLIARATRAVAVLFAAFACGRSEAQITVPTDYRNYAIIGGSTVFFDAYATVLGDVYSVGDLTVGFGYGIQRTALTGGNFFTRSNFILSSGFTLNSNVAANGNILVTSGTLAGNAQYGGTTSGNITGTKTLLPNSVPLIAVPTARTFTPGTQNVSAPGNLVLQPGSYGNVALTGSFDALTLSSGDYFLSSLNGNGASTLNLNITNGPIRVYSAGDISFGSSLDVFVNGVKIDTNANAVQAEGAMASNVLFQSGGNIRVEGFIGSFVGTLFAPNGTVTLDTQNWYGSVIAGGAIHQEGYLVKKTFNFGNAAMAGFSALETNVIVGGTKLVNASVANLAPAEGAALNFNASTQVNSGGITVTQPNPNTGAVQPGTAAPLSFSVTGTQVGQAKVGVNINDPNAYSPNSSGIAAINVLDHASAVVTPGTAARAMLGSTAFGTASIQNATATYRAGLQIIDNGGLLDLTNGAVVAKGSSVTVRGALDTAAYGPTTSTFTVQLSDDQNLAGATALPDKQVTVSGNILDNRRVTAAAAVDLGVVHSGAVASGTAVLSTTGADNLFTRITVNNSGVDSNGIAVTGTNSFRFGLDGLSSTRTLSGTPNKLGVVTGSFTLTTNAEANVAGTQTLANVPVSYSVKVYSGQATWNQTTSGVWSDHPSWADNLSNAGAGSPGIVSAFLTDTATFGNVIGNAAATVALNGSNPTLANLRFENNLGGSYTIAPGTGGALTIKATSGGIAISSAAGSNRISAPISLTGGTLISIADPQSTLTLDGALTSSAGITKIGPGTLAISSAGNSLGSVTISEGTLRGNVASLNTPLTNNAALVFDQPTDATFAGTIAGTGSITKTGAGRLSFSGINNFNANAPLTIASGSLVLPMGMPLNGAGIQLVAGGTLEAANSVPRAINGTGTIQATGDLTIGRSSQPAQLNLGGAANVGGTLNVGANAVVVLSSDVAVLGSLTTIGHQGSLTTLHGAQLGSAQTIDSTKVLTANGDATINGNFINNGVVNGPTQAGQKLTFTQGVSGAGSLSGNILFAGSFNPGNSPAAIGFAGNATFANTSQLKIEIGGTEPGLQFDQLNVSQHLTLGGTLAVSLINDFVPNAGQSFDLLDFESLSGAFSSVQLPTIPGRPLGWDISSLYTEGTLSVVTTYLRGDWNRDGQTTPADISAMLRALTNVDSYAADNLLNGSQLAAIGDFDNSGKITNRDIQGFLNYLAAHGNGAIEAVPEPNSVILLSLALVLLPVLLPARARRVIAEPR